MSINANPNPAPTSAGRKVKLTSKVRRGLAHVRQMARDFCDPDKAPGFTQVRFWSRAKQSEYDAAMAWLEQNEEQGDDRG